MFADIAVVIFFLQFINWISPMFIYRYIILWSYTNNIADVKYNTNRIRIKDPGMKFILL